MQRKGIALLATIRMDIIFKKGRCYNVIRNATPTLADELLA